MVRSSIVSTENKDFSINVGSNTFLEGGGWTELYTLEGRPAVKSYLYEFLGWIYSAYSLYPVLIQDPDPERIIWIQMEGDSLKMEKPIISTYKYKDLELRVFDNSTKKP